MMMKRNYNDEQMLLDFLSERCDDSQRSAVEKRLLEDQEFRLHHDDIASTLGALKLLPELEPPQGLVEATLARVRQKGQTEALLAKEAAQTRRPRSSTFSLRELAAVAAVLALLACVLVPSFRQANDQAMAKQCADQARQVGSAMASYADENNGNLPSALTGARHWLPSQTHNHASNSEALFRLIAGKYAKAEAFQCPAVSRSDNASFAFTSSMIDFPRGDFVSYSYQHNLAPVGTTRNDPTLVPVAAEMAILADDSPMFKDGQFQNDRIGAINSDNHNRAGQNVLYLDMHVAWAEKPTVGVGNDNIYLAQGIDEYRGDEAPTKATDSFLLPAYSPRR